MLSGRRTERLAFVKYGFHCVQVKVTDERRAGHDIELYNTSN